MTAIEVIVKTIKANTKCVFQHQSYSSKPGLYAFSLADHSTLKEFGTSNQIIYVGKAEDSLKARDLNTHFKSGKTGHSTLRRSIGAILKSELCATAFSRNGTLNWPNIDNYRFDSKSEQKISDWMDVNLLIGYWEYEKNVENKSLRRIEEELIVNLKPTLDLDRRTRKYNKHAPALEKLRQICKDEATSHVNLNIERW